MFEEALQALRVVFRRQPAGEPQPASAQKPREKPRGDAQRIEPREGFDDAE